MAQDGKPDLSGAEQLQITCNAGESNSSRRRLWRVELPGFAEEPVLQISISHSPPGKSKRDKIEHRMFCRITQNWRGRPLVSHEVVVYLIGAVRTRGT